MRKRGDRPSLALEPGERLVILLRASGRTWIATSRPSLGSFARSTSPFLPRPGEKGSRRDRGARRSGSSSQVNAPLCAPLALAASPPELGGPVEDDGRRIQGVPPQRGDEKESL